MTCSARPGSRSALRRSARSSLRAQPFGEGSPQSYVDGFRDALWVGAVLALVAAAATAMLIRGYRGDEAVVPGDIALETPEGGADRWPAQAEAQSA